VRKSQGTRLDQTNPKLILDLMKQEHERARLTAQASVICAIVFDAAGTCFAP